MEFFFKNLRINETERYKKRFPYVSLCGSEHNYLRCDDLPFVVTGLDTRNDLIQLNHLKSAHWLIRFVPDHLYHNPSTGRVYYLFKDKHLAQNNAKPTLDENGDEVFYKRKGKHFDRLPCKISLVKSSISLMLLKSMQSREVEGKEIYEFEYKSKKHVLNSTEQKEISEMLEKFSSYKELPEEVFK